MKVSQVLENVEAIASTSQVPTELVDTVVSWVSNGYVYNLADDNIIRKHMHMFRYSGPMYREVGLEDPDGDADVDSVLLGPETHRLASWSSSEKGVDNWVDAAYSTFETDCDVYFIRLKQQGVGFDVTALYKAVKDQSTIKPWIISLLRRASDVGEIIAPYYPNAEIYDYTTFEATSDDADDDDQ